MSLNNAKIIGFVLFCLLSIFFGASLIAIIGMGQFKNDMELLKIPEYFWFYRDNGYVMGWLVRGIGIATATAGQNGRQQVKFAKHVCWMPRA
jgi:type IV secretion system protein VirD4